MVRREGFFIRKVAAFMRSTIFIKINIITGVPVTDVVVVFSHVESELYRRISLMNTDVIVPVNDVFKRLINNQIVVVFAGCRQCDCLLDIHGLRILNRD